MKKLTRAECVARAKRTFRKKIQDGELMSLALNEPMSALEKLKKDLCGEFVRIRTEMGVSTKDIAFACDLNEHDVTMILKYRIELFTSDLLVEKLEALQNAIKRSAISIEKLPAGGKQTPD